MLNISHLNLLWIIIMYELMNYSGDWMEWISFRVPWWLVVAAQSWTTAHFSVSVRGRQPCAVSNNQDQSVSGQHEARTCGRPPPPRQYLYHGVRLSDTITFLLCQDNNKTSWYEYFLLALLCLVPQPAEAQFGFINNLFRPLTNLFRWFLFDDTLTQWRYID